MALEKRAVLFATSESKWVVAGLPVFASPTRAAALYRFDKEPSREDLQAIKVLFTVNPMGSVTVKE
jgi:hypothetical protein